MSEEGAVEMLAVVAHRLLGSVAAIKGTASLLQRPDLSDEHRRQLLSMVGEEAERLDDLVRSLLVGAPV